MAIGIAPQTMGGVGGMRGLPLSEVTKFLGGMCAIVVQVTTRKVEKLYEDEDAAECTVTRGGKRR